MTRLSTVIKSNARAATSDVSTAFPATIEVYAFATQSVTVQPILRDDKGRKLPRISNIPVAFPQGGGFKLDFPIAPGDVVLIVCSDRSLEEWLQYGEPDVSPQDGRRHALTDAIAIPGLSPFSAPLSASATKLQLGQDGGTMLTVGPAGAAITNGTDELFQLVIDLLDTLTSALVSTALGPQPLDAATLADIATIKAALTVLGDV